jgi:hypothetical protein
VLSVVLPEKGLRRQAGNQTGSCRTAGSGKHSVPHAHSTVMSRALVVCAGIECAAVN